MHWTHLKPAWQDSSAFTAEGSGSQSQPWDRAIEDQGMDISIEDQGMDRSREDQGMDRSIEDQDMDRSIEDQGMDRSIEDQRMIRSIELLLYRIIITTWRSEWWVRGGEWTKGVKFLIFVDFCNLIYTSRLRYFFIKCCSIPSDNGRITKYYFNQGYNARKVIS